MPIHEVHGFPVSTPNLNITRSKITLDSGATYIDLVDAIATAEESGALTLHTANTSNPHSTTAAQVGAYTTAQTDALIAAIESGVRVTDAAYGATGLGVSDDTAEIQACIDANKGGTIIFPRGTYLVGTTLPILLDGATYDDTTLLFEDGAVLKTATRATETTYNWYSAAWATLVIRLCDGVTVRNITINGNRTAQPIQEHCLSLVVAGATNVTISDPKFREMRGDGIYVCQSIPNSSSVQSRHVTITNVDCNNSAADGRNTVSIVAGEDITVDGVVQQNMGGTFLYVAASGAAALPGGAALSAAFTCTISNATPAVVTKVAHGLLEDYQVYFTTTGALPTGLTANTTGTIGGAFYWVIATGLTADAFQVSATRGGPAINTSSAGSGVHTCVPCRWVVQPGSFVDIEPDFDYQLCRRINITNLRGSSYGTTPIGVQGITTDKTVTYDVSVSDAIVYQLSGPTLLDDTGALTRTNNQIIQTSRTTGVKISNVTGRFLNAWGYGVIVTGTDNTTLTNVRVNRVHTGCNVGNGDYDAATNGVWNAEIDVYVNQLSRYGFEVGKITNCKIGGWVSAPTSGQFTAMYGVICQLYTQTNSTYSVSLTPSSDWTRSYRLNGASFANTSIKNCHLGAADGSTWASDTARFGDTGMRFENVTGITEVTAIPTGGVFAIGQFIRNVGTESDVLGWHRLTASNGTSRDTDWRVVAHDNYSVLNADRTGTDVNTAQAIFGSAQDAITLAASTTYEFEAFYWLARTAGTTSHTTAVLFGGTATFTSIDYTAFVANPSGAALGNAQMIPGTAATALTLTAANTSATENLIVTLRGVMRINGAGTLIPQFQFSAAPGGAPDVKRGSFFRAKRLGSSSFTYAGAWA